MSAPAWSVEYARAVVAEWRRQVPSAKLEPWEQQRLEEEIAEALEDVNEEAHSHGGAVSLPPHLQVSPGLAPVRTAAETPPFGREPGALLSKASR